jgi:hypothetical protein
MELTDALKSLRIETAKSLKGHARRLFRARTVKELGPGGPRRAAHALGWSRMTSRQGRQALASGCICLDAFALRGRKRAEDQLPQVLSDLQAIVERQRQADPQCRTNRLYTRVSAGEVRRQLLVQTGDTDDALPTVQTITAKLNALGYFPKQVAKSQAPKKFQKPMPSLRR